MALEHFAIDNPIIPVPPTCAPVYTFGWLNHVQCSALSSHNCDSTVPASLCSGQAHLQCGTAVPHTATGCSHVVPQEDRCEIQEGNPVLVASGQKTESVIDFASAGPQPLEFVRNYDSNYTITYSNRGFAGDLRIEFSRFGRSWRSTFDSGFAYSGSNPAAPVNGDRAHFATDASREIVFIRSSGAWSPAYFSGSTWFAGRTDIDIKFSVVGTEARLTYGNGDVWAYGFDGRLKEIRRRDGYTQTLTYTNGLNTSVTDNLSRTLTFTYNANGLLDTMTAPDGKVFKYRYKSVVQLSQIVLDHEYASQAISLEYVLEKVIYPDATPATDEDNPAVTYHYEDSNFPRSLTGISDERGVRYATYAYDAQGRVSSTVHAGGADNTTFAYDDPNNRRTVTNPLGKDTVYHFDNFQGRRRLTEVEGLASANCAASDTTYAHDTNGYVNQETDAEGRITKYVRDSRGLPTTVTEGFGAPEQRVTTLTWHATFELPTQVVEPGRTTDLTYDANGRLTGLTQTDTTTHSLPYVTNGQTRTWAYTYSTAGLLLTVNGPLAGASDTITYAYNSNGYLSSITDEVGLVTTVLAVNGRGQPTSIRDPNGIDSALTYDDRGRLKTVSVDTASASPAVTAIDYDAAGQVTKITFRTRPSSPTPTTTPNGSRASPTRSGRSSNTPATPWGTRRRRWRRR